MSTSNPANRSVRLGLEQLEAREVPSASFPGRGGLDVAFGNVIPTLDPTNEIITSTGPGLRAQVRVWNSDGSLRFSFYPFGQYRGGVYVALGQFVRSDPFVNPTDPDPMELVVSTAGGTTGRVKIYSFENGTLQLFAKLTPFGPNYFGGVQIASGDVAGDRSGAPFTNQWELIVGRETGASTIKVYANDQSSPTPQFFEIRRFQAFEDGYRGGVSLASANIHPQLNVPTDPYNYEYAEVIVGKASNLPNVKIFDVQSIDPVTLADYMAFDTTFRRNRTGINVYAGDTDATRGAEIYVNPMNTSRVRILDGWTGGLWGDFNVATPPRILGINLAIEVVDDENFNILPRDLIAVYANGRFGQVPIIFPGQFNSPAGLNGSFPAA